MSDDIGSEFCQLCLVIDTREKDIERIDAMANFWEAHGGIVEKRKVDLGDYEITGYYKDVEISLLLEHKVLTGDFFPSLDGMPERFFQAFKDYKDVGLMIEEGNYTIKPTDDEMDAWVQNDKMQLMTGAEGIGTLSMFNNFCGSMAEAGVHVRTFRTIKHFPITVSGLLKNLAKPIHRGIAIKNPEKTFYPDMMNILAKLPGVGAKTAEKGLKYIPNLERFCSLGLDDLKDIFGEVSGRKLYSFITNPTRKAECAKNWEEYYQGVLAKHQPKSKERAKNKENLSKKVESKVVVTPKQKNQLERNLEDTALPKQLTNNPALEFLEKQGSQFTDNSDDIKKWYSIILKYIQNQPKGIMLSEIVKANPNCPEEIILKLIQEYMNEGEAYEPKIGMILATNLNVYVEQTKPSEILSVVEATPILERDLSPRVKDVVEFIRQKPRTMDEIGKYFGFSPTYCIQELYKLKEKGKIWFEKATSLWRFGLDNNPAPIIAEPEMDVGV